MNKRVIRGNLVIEWGIVEAIIAGMALIVSIISLYVSTVNSRYNVS